MPPERLQKILARSGCGSRRAVEVLAAAGRVTVNGAVVAPGHPVAPGDRVLVDGRPVRLVWQTAPRVLLYNKPVGEICTRTDPDGRPTVFSRLPPLGNGRWIAVGRLDINTSGLLLFTNDGALANQMMHPASGLQRRYLVRILGRVSAEVLQRLRSGVPLDDGPASFASITPLQGSGMGVGDGTRPGVADTPGAANQWFEVSVGEGRNRLVRRLWESQGLQVSRLMRIAYGPLEAERGLGAGKWRELTTDELTRLQAVLSGHAGGEGHSKVQDGSAARSAARVTGARGRGVQGKAEPRGAARRTTEKPVNKRATSRPRRQRKGAKPVAHRGHRR